MKYDDYHLDRHNQIELKCRAEFFFVSDISYLTFLCGNQIVADDKVDGMFVEILFWFIKRFVLVSNSMQDVYTERSTQIYGMSYTHCVY